MKKRMCYLGLTIITIIAGLISRKIYSYLPSIVNLYLGDILYGVMMYWIICFVFLEKRPFSKFVIALFVCLLIEFSQLVDLKFLNLIRQNRFGRLIIGQGFLKSDLLAYFIGVLTGSIINEFFVFKNKRAIR